MWDDLVCPIDQATIAGSDGWLVCEHCGRGYPVLDDLPTFLPVDEDPRWRQSLEECLCDDSPAPEASHTQLRRRARQLERWLEPHICLNAEDRVLQIGLTGEGEAHHFRHGIAYGVDPLAGVLADRGTLKWGRMRWISGRGEELPFPAQRFRLILLIDSLSYVESPARVLAEIARCLTDDGMVFLTLPLLSRRTTRSAHCSSKSQPLHDFTPRHLIELCREAGLRRVWSGHPEEVWEENAVAQFAGQGMYSVLLSGNQRKAAPLTNLDLTTVRLALPAG